jgi:hypothetical protein
MRNGAMNRNFGAIAGLSLQGLDIGAGINTDDATATAADIQQGLIAYAKGRRLVGTSTRKRWATGNVVVDPGNYSNRIFTVTGLQFRPRFISAYVNFDNAFRFYIKHDVAYQGQSYVLTFDSSNNIILDAIFLYRSNFNDSRITISSNGFIFESGLNGGSDSTLLSFFATE